MPYSVSICPNRLTLVGPFRYTPSCPSYNGVLTNTTRPTKYPTTEYAISMIGACHVKTMFHLISAFTSGISTSSTWPSPVSQPSTCKTMGSSSRSRRGGTIRVDIAPLVPDGAGASGELLIAENMTASVEASRTAVIENTMLQYHAAGPTQCWLGFSGHEKQPITATARRVPYVC